jgi:hypothetical protein
MERLKTASGVVFLTVISSASVVAATEFEDLKSCFEGNVINLEPHQDNMLDLAELIFVTTCEQEKKSYSDSVQPRDQETMKLYYSMMRIIVQQMVVKARADRLSIEIK